MKLALPEDVILTKLMWFRQYGIESDKQWRDVSSIIRRGRPVEHALGIVGGEVRLMRPCVALLAQLIHKLPLAEAKCFAEHIAPMLPHDL